METERKDQRYIDNQKKWAAVLNPKVSAGRLMNALAECATSFGALIGNNEDLGLGHYEDNKGDHLALISKFPYIILRAKNGNQLRKLRRSAAEAGLTHNCFVNTMHGISLVQQQRATREVAEEDLDYIAVVVFGATEKIDPLTKRFRLFD